MTPNLLAVVQLSALLKISVLRSRCTVSDSKLYGNCCIASGLFVTAYLCQCKKPFIMFHMFDKQLHQEAHQVRRMPASHLSI